MTPEQLWGNLIALLLSPFIAWIVVEIAFRRRR